MTTFAVHEDSQIQVGDIDPRDRNQVTDRREAIPTFRPDQGRCIGPVVVEHRHVIRSRDMGYVGQRLILGQIPAGFTDDDCEFCFAQHCLHAWRHNDIAIPDCQRRRGFRVIDRIVRPVTVFLCTALEVHVQHENLRAAIQWGRQSHRATFSSFLRARYASSVGAPRGRLGARWGASAKGVVSSNQLA